MTVNLYCVTNKTTGKLYVGITEQSVWKRWQGHYNHAAEFKTKFQAAIVQYGRDDFEPELLFTYANRNEACAAEIEIISQLDLVHKGYNSSPGGTLIDRSALEPIWAARTGIRRDPSIGHKISAAKRGVPFTEAHKRALRKSKSVSCKRGPLSTDHRAAISATKKRQAEERKSAYVR